MHADPKRVGLRRIKRRLKAAASVVVALAAGTFLACRGDSPEETNAREPDDASPGSPSREPGPGESAPAATLSARTSDAASAASASAAPDAGTDAGAPPPRRPAPKPTVDKTEHRKGMPVPDNLLE
jgi:hypothetical protein